MTLIVRLKRNDICRETGLAVKLSKQAQKRWLLPHWPDDGLGMLLMGGDKFIQVVFFLQFSHYAPFGGAHFALLRFGQIIKSAQMQHAMHGIEN